MNDQQNECTYIENGKHYVFPVKLLDQIRREAVDSVMYDDYVKMKVLEAKKELLDEVESLNLNEYDINLPHVTWKLLRAKTLGEKNE
jgi:hypothetical protein